MSTQAEKIGTAVSSLRVFASKAASGGKTDFLCRTCWKYHDGPSKTCTDCLARSRTKQGTSQTKCNERHFPAVGDAEHFIKTQLDDCRFAHFAIDHTGDRDKDNAVMLTAAAAAAAVTDRRRHACVP